MNSDYPFDYENQPKPNCGYGFLGLDMGELYNSIIHQNFEIIKCPKCNQSFDCAFPFYTELCSKCEYLKNLIR